MTSTEKRIAGLRAKSKGDFYEVMFKTISQRQGFDVVRIPNAAKVVRINGRLETIRQKSPFDFVVTAPKKVMFFDIKCTEAAAFPRSLIKEHQADELTKTGKNWPSGYIVFFESVDRAIFFSFTVLNEMLGQIRGSLAPKDGTDLGPLDSFDLNKIEF